MEHTAVNILLYISHSLHHTLKINTLRPAAEYARCCCH